MRILNEWSISTVHWIPPARTTKFAAADRRWHYALSMASHSSFQVSVLTALLVLPAVLDAQTPPQTHPVDAHAV
jgi:DNA-binding FadR family transcriptional regulator